MLARRRLLQLGSRAGIMLASGATMRCRGIPEDGGAAGDGGVSLRRLAQACGIRFGTAIGPLVETMPAYRDVVVADCGIVVPEYEMKWRHVAPTPGGYDFRAVDRRLALALSNGMEFRGHTLVWHDSLPPWFDEVVTSENAARLLTRHIDTLVRRYAGRVQSWDVVNEALDAGEPGGLRATPWLRLIGPGYVQLAFEAAAAADPRALLVYNDYGLVAPTAASAAKRQATLRLLEGLVARRVPVHALGLQSHLDASGAFDAEGLARFCGEVAALGLKIMVTELDVADQLAPADIAARDAVVAATYRAFLDCLLDQPATTAVLTWGLSDIHSWLQTYRPRADGLPCRVLPYDATLRKKPAWSAIAEAFGTSARRGRSAHAH